MLRMVVMALRMGRISSMADVMEGCYLWYLE